MTASGPRTFAEGTFTPDPGRGSLFGMLRAQAGVETRLAMRNGEQVLLTILIPIALLVGLSLIPLLPVPAPRVQTVLPSVLALAVMSSAFTSQAIALGFDRRYGVLRRLAATALPRWLLVSGRLVAVLAVVVLQVVLLCLVGLALGWQPGGTDLQVAVPAVLLGAAAFGALGILLGGTLRAEITLAVANLVWFVLLLAGGIVIPLSALPGPMAAVAAALPSGALAESLRGAMGAAPSPGAAPLLVLLAWTVVAAALAARTVRWR